ncbi:MAG: RtcB family protein [Candidatus Dadabacteria bacterium]|nr:MAG: RtcB family protein [Candidatus Dadabacteria bacterium]
MAEEQNIPLEKIDKYKYRIPSSWRKEMRVDGIVYGNEELIKHSAEDKALEQVANVACLPGIVKASLAMPDIHWGYGFCIGGVAATDPEKGGVISPGGVGYDINCGVRLIRSDIEYKDIKPRLSKLVDALFSAVPCGVGQEGEVKFKKEELKKLVVKGSSYVIERGYGWAEDLEFTEAKGRLEGARPDFVSERAYERGQAQCGTLGSGNHFLEVQVVEEIYDKAAAEVFGLEEGMITVMIHSGSRGFGYQVCEDYLKELRDAPKKYGITLPDKQLLCAPIKSKEGERYLGAMRAAANFAWSNRQIMTHLTREVFERIFNTSAERLGLYLVYDVAHNIAKFEPYQVNGKKKTLCVHRKGATRAFPAGHKELPTRYRSVGQPVLIPGDMGRYSYVLVGRQKSMEETFGSTCHGAGRQLSRRQAVKASKGRDIQEELLSRGVVARARGRRGLEEEQPEAYKDVSLVVSVVHGAGISELVAKLKPIGVIKG